jgi:hypothetical protein
VIDKDKRIICVDTAKGTTHDFKLFKQSRLPLKASTCAFVDLGYLGIAKIHANCAILYKASKLHPLNNEQKEDNRQNVKRTAKISRPFHAKGCLLLIISYENTNKDEPTGCLAWVKGL